MRRLWQACAGPPGIGRWLHALVAAVVAAAAAALVAAAGSALAGDSGTRLLRALPHYAAPGLAAGFVATALAAFHLRSLARNASRIGIAIRTAAHLCAPPLLWLAAMPRRCLARVAGSAHPHRLRDRLVLRGDVPRVPARSGRTGPHREHRGGGRGAARRPCSRRGLRAPASRASNKDGPAKGPPVQHRSPRPVSRS